jgi:hypothetical protein
MIEIISAMILGGFIGVGLTLISLSARIGHVNEIALLEADIACDVLNATLGKEIDMRAYRQKVRLLTNMVSDL